MEARQQGTGRSGRRPRDAGHPLTNLTQLMSQPANEPASVPSLRQIPRRYLALGLIFVAIVLLGALVLVRDNSGPTSTPTVETFNAAPSSLVSTVASVPGLGLRRRRGELARQSGHAAGAGGERERADVARHADGGPPLPVVFFYGAEFAPYAAAERWPLILALSRFGTFSQLGLMQSSRDDGVRRSLDLHLLEGLVLESLRDPASRSSATARLNPTGARYLEPPGARRPPVRGDRRLRDERHHLLAARRGQPVRARRRQPSRPPCSPGSHRARSPPTSPPRPAP